MTTERHRHVALFQARWPVQSQTVNAAITLARAGYAVDLFLFETPFYVEPRLLDQWETIHVYDFSAAGRSALLRAVRGPATKVWRRSPGSSGHLVPRAVLSRTLVACRGAKYACIIGVEKAGLIWAGMVAERLTAPLVYYSLELYTREHVAFNEGVGSRGKLRRLREAERDYHRRAAATIIQTPERARLLAKDTGAELSAENTFYVPVSVLGPARDKPSTELHDLLGLDKAQKLILYFGMISAERYVFELTEAAQRFPDDWVLVMHGWGEPPIMRQIRSLDTRRKVAMSLEMVSSSRIGDLIASAAVGVALYPPLLANDRLTAFASEKMALYMQQRVPFVSFDYEDYRGLARRYRCGEVLTDVADLVAPVATILRSHDEYRANAALAFADHYDFAHNFEPVITGIDGLRTSR